MTFLLGNPIFGCYVSFREGKIILVTAQDLPLCSGCPQRKLALRVTDCLGAMSHFLLEKNTSQGIPLERFGQGTGLSNITIKTYFQIQIYIYICVCNYVCKYICVYKYIIIYIYLPFCKQTLQNC